MNNSLRILKLIIVRHGETEENIAGIMQGQSRGTLSAQGQAQIKLLAERFKNEPIDAILSSDLMRAKKTTEEIAQFHAADVSYLPGLRERSSGIFEGRTNEEYQRAVRAHPEGALTFTPEGGESIADLFARTDCILEMIMQTHVSGTLLVSTHSGPLLCMICTLLRYPREDFWTIQLENTAVNIFFITDGRVVDHTLNCTRHLSA